MQVVISLAITKIIPRSQTGIVQVNREPLRAHSIPEFSTTFQNHEARPIDTYMLYWRERYSMSTTMWWRTCGGHDLRGVYLYTPG